MLLYAYFSSVNLPSFVTALELMGCKICFLTNSSFCVKKHKMNKMIQWIINRLEQWIYLEEEIELIKPCDCPLEVCFGLSVALTRTLLMI